MGDLYERFNKTVAGKMARGWGELGAGEGAILIAWQLMFSLFPLVTGLLAIVGLVIRDPDRQEALAEAITSNFPSQASDLVSFLTETRTLTGLIGLISIIGLLWSGSSLFAVMERVFDRFYGAQDRNLVWQRLMALMMTLVYAVLLTVSVAASSVTSFLVGISEQVLPFEIPSLAFVLGWAISFVAALVMFVTLLTVVPHVSLRLRHAWPGGLLSAILFMVLTQAFPVYLRFLGGGFAAYKALGVFLLLMTWFYFLGMVLVAGALLNATFTGHCDRALAARQLRLERSVPVAVRETSSGGPVMRTERRDGPLTVIARTGLVVVVASFTLIAARRIAAAIWRAITREEPPS